MNLTYIEADTGVELEAPLLRNEHPMDHHHHHHEQQQQQQQKSHQEARKKEATCKFLTSTFFVGMIIGIFTQVVDIAGIGLLVEIEPHSIMQFVLLATIMTASTVVVLVCFLCYIKSMIVQFILYLTTRCPLLDDDDEDVARLEPLLQDVERVFACGCLCGCYFGWILFHLVVSGGEASMTEIRWVALSVTIVIFVVANVCRPLSVNSQESANEKVENGEEGKILEVTVV